jgi:hypothetical protein
MAALTKIRAACEDVTSCIRYPPRKPCDIVPTVFNPLWQPLQPEVSLIILHRRV